MKKPLENIAQLEELDYIKQQWQYESGLFHNKQHPEDFPPLPELPASRYIYPEFFKIEKKYLSSIEYPLLIYPKYKRANQHSISNRCIST